MISANDNRLPKTKPFFKRTLRELKAWQLVVVSLVCLIACVLDTYILYQIRDMTNTFWGWFFYTCLTALILFGNFKFYILPAAKAARILYQVKQAGDPRQDTQERRGVDNPREPQVEDSDLPSVALRDKSLI